MGDALTNSYPARAYSVLFDSSITWSLSPAHSIQQIQCCLDKMYLIYKQFRKSRMRPGEPRGEQTLLVLSPLPTSFLSPATRSYVLLLRGLLLEAHCAWPCGASVQLVKAGPWLQPLQTRERPKAFTPEPIWPVWGLGDRYGACGV